MASDLISALIIAVVQGVTEWVPVSSSGHLVVVERMLGFDGGLVFDVALHFGTLMAVFVYFGREITDIVQDFFRGRFDSDNGRLGLLVLVATIPAVVFGFLFRAVFESAFDSLGIVALGFGVTGLFLFIASLDTEHKSGNSFVSVPQSSKRVQELQGFKGRGRFGYGRALLVGFGQVLSLLPGVSRSGATISSGLVLGLKEKDAVKFSFLMSIPVVFGANILVIGNQRLPSELIWATLVSFLIGLLAIHLLYKYVLTSRKNLRWFGAYALLLGLVIGGYVVL